MTHQLPAVLGALRYEFRMQARRPTVWITFAVFTSLLFLLLNQGADSLGAIIPNLVAHRPLQTVLAWWSFNVNTFFPICVGTLLASRLPRDRRAKVDELFTAMPVSLSARLVGKYLGSLLATLLPVLLVYAVGVGYIISLAHDPTAIPLALETFAVVALPGILFVAAFSIAVPAILWVPLYQFLFIGYWYWQTLWFHAELPNLGRTLLAPIGVYALGGIYGYLDSDPRHPPQLSPTPAEGVASIVLLVGTAALVLVVLERYLIWRQARQ